MERRTPPDGHRRALEAFSQAGSAVSGFRELSCAGLTAADGKHAGQHILKPTDLLFPGEFGGRLAGSVFRRVWDKARAEVLQPHEYKSPAGKRVYDCRHTCLTAWLNKGIPPPQVAEWAGNSVPVLLPSMRGASSVSGTTI